MNNSSFSHNMIIQKNNHGVALLITLSIITIMIVTALELNRRMRSSLIMSASGRDVVTLMSMASSGIHGAMALLVIDKQDSLIDSVREDWANPVKIAAVLDGLEFDNGHVEVAITDELSRIQVNALVDSPDGQHFDPLQQQLLFRFLDLQISPEERNIHTSPQAITDSIKDWIDYGDADAVTGLNGAESYYYQGLDPPYSCANIFLTDISDLMRIKGITPTLYTGTSEKPSLEGYLTVFGMFEDDGEEMVYPGKININTAEAPVLAALLSPEYENLADRLIDYRNDISKDTPVRDLSDPAWYKKVPGFESAWIDPRLLTTSSDTFRVESTAYLGTSHLTIITVINRQKDPESGKYWCNILSWQIK